MHIRSQSAPSLRRKPATDPLEPARQARIHAEAVEVVRRLQAEMLPAPQDRISRSDAMHAIGLGNGPVGERPVKEVNLKEMLALIILAAVRERGMKIAAGDHKSNAAEPVGERYGAFLSFKREHTGAYPGRIAKNALAASYAKTASCDEHACRNFILASAIAKQLLEAHPCLGEYMPVIRMVGADEPGWCHYWIMADKFCGDTWVMFPLECEASDCYKPGRIIAAQFDSHRPWTEPNANAEFLAELDRLTNEEGPSITTPEGYDYADPQHWEQERLNFVDFTHDGFANPVYVCEGIVHDPDHVGADGLRVRMQWAEQSAFALESGGQSPHRRGNDPAQAEHSNWWETLLAQHEPGKEYESDGEARVMRSKLWSDDSSSSLDESDSDSDNSSTASTSISVDLSESDEERSE